MEENEEPKEPDFDSVELEFELASGEKRRLSIRTPNASLFDFSTWFLMIMEKNHGWFPLSENERVNQTQLARVSRIA